MFGKLKLRNYLLGVFGLIIALATIITCVGMFGLTNTKTLMQDFISNTLGAELAVKTCRIEVNVAARDLREMVFTTDPAHYQELKTQINESIANIEQQVEIFKQTHGTEDGLAQQYETQFDEWFTIADRAIAALDAGNQEQAIDIIINECTVALSELAQTVQKIDATVATEKQQATEHAESFVMTCSIVVAVAFVIAVIMSIVCSLRATLNITKTTEKIKNAVLALSKGDLSARVDYHANNEFGELAERMNFSFEELARYVDAIDHNMSEFANGNFTYQNQTVFLGDFAHIQHSVDYFSSKINDALNNIDAAAAQVTAGAQQVADGSQALAQGATEQSGSLDMLTVTLKEVAAQIHSTAEYSANANDLGEHANEVIQQSKTEMEQMQQAIHNISKSSEDIQKIIKVIDDIAFQTNILALNAAVEAARAGNAGKGFAVVADEVGNLAQKSAQAARSTTELIENSLQQVAYGEKLVSSTTQGFGEVTKYAEEIIEMARKMAAASKEQTTSMEQITENITQIASVVQMNSATAEEIAAASEQLRGQSEVMKESVSQFQIYTPNRPDFLDMSQQSSTVHHSETVEPPTATPIEETMVYAHEPVSTHSFTDTSKY